MEESKKNKMWMIVSIVAIIVIIVLAVMLINNNNKGSDGKLDKTGSKAKKENVKIVKNEASKLALEEYTSDTFSMKNQKDGQLKQEEQESFTQLEYMIHKIQITKYI